MKEICLERAQEFEIVRLNFIQEATDHARRGDAAQRVKQAPAVSSAIVNVIHFTSAADDYLHKYLLNEKIITLDEQGKLSKQISKAAEQAKAENFEAAQKTLIETDSMLWELMLEKAVSCECEK